MVICLGCCHNLPLNVDIFILGHLNCGPESHEGRPVINVRCDWKWHFKINTVKHSGAFCACTLHCTYSHWPTNWHTDTHRGIYMRLLPSFYMIQWRRENDASSGQNKWQVTQDQNIWERPWVPSSNITK